MGAWGGLAFGVVWFMAALVFSGCNGQVLQSLGVVQAAAPVQFQPLPLTYVVEHPAACVELNLQSNTAWTASADVPWIVSVTPATLGVVKASSTLNSRPCTCLGSPVSCRWLARWP